MDNNKQSFNSKDNKIRYTRIINAENTRTFTDEIGGSTWETYLMKTRIPKRLTTIDIIQQEIKLIQFLLGYMSTNYPSILQKQNPFC